MTPQHAPWPLAGRRGGMPPRRGWTSPARMIGFGAHRCPSTRVFPQPARHVDRLERPACFTFLVFPQLVRSAGETNPNRAAFSSAYSYRTLLVSSLQSESPSASTSPLYGIHRKTAAFSIARIDTTRPHYSCGLDSAGTYFDNARCLVHNYRLI